jgi:hypothetical protein
VIVYLFAQFTLLVTSLTKVTVAAPAQLSPADTPVVACAGTAPAHVTVVFDGQLMVGATLSNTVMICAQVAVLLHRSVARKVRVTVNLLTQVTLLVTSPTKLIVAAPLQLSVAVTPVVVCAGIALAQVTVVFAGQLILGATLSLTVIVCAHVALFPHKSAALNVRVMVYLLAHVALLVASPTKLMTAGPLQLSVAVTPVVVCDGTEPEHVTVMFAGQVIDGGTMSRIVIN